MNLTDPDLAGLYAAVLAAPDDDAPRLVLADALEQRDDPRGRFISLQVRRARLVSDPDSPDPEYAELRALERELYTAHARTWAPELEGLQVDFHRGFPFGVSGRTSQVLSVAQDVLREVPLLQHVGLTDLADPRALEDFLASPLASGLRSFSLTTNDEGLQVVSCAAALSRVTRLQVRCADVTHAGAEAIAAGPWRLRRLILERSATGEGLGALLTPSLEELTLIDDVIGVAGARALAQHGARLRALRLTASRVGDEGAALLATALPGVETLVLNDARIGVEGARSLGASTSLAALTALDLRANRLGKGGASGLLKGNGLARLDSLILRDCALKDAGAKVVASCQRPLQRLDVRDNALTDSSATALSTALFAPSLKTLNVNRNRLTPAGFAALKASLPHVTVFGANQLTDLRRG